MSWQRLNPEIPQEVTDAGQALTSGLETIRTSLQAARALLQARTLLTSPLTGELDAINAALNTLAGAITSALTTLLDDGGAYLLPIPLPKKGIARLVTDDDQPAEDVPETQVPSGALAAEVPPAVTQDPLWVEAFAAEDLFLGGNAYVLRTVTESLFDVGDTNRPTFGASAAWAYSVMLAGSSDLGAVLSVGSYLHRLFGNRRQGANGVAVTRGYTEITGTSLRATVSGRENFVVLSWDRLVRRTLDAGWVLRPTAYAIIRSTGVEAMTAHSVLDLFPTREITEGMTGLYGARVLKVAPYDGLVCRYVDRTPLDPGVPAYYHLAVRGTLQGTYMEADIGYDMLSACCRFKREPHRTNTQLSVAPDWIRTPSIARAFPALNRLVDSLSEAVRDIASSAATGQTIARASLASLDAEIQKFERIIQNLETLLGQLEAVFATPNAGVYFTVRSGEGDLGSFVTDLARALSDRSDANYPPFETGDEYILGYIILLVGPTPTAIAAALEMLRLLFGTTDPSPILAGIRDITASVEQTLPAPRSPDPAPQTFNEDLSPRPVGQGDSTCD